MKFEHILNGEILTLKSELNRSDLKKVNCDFVFNDKVKFCDIGLTNAIEIKDCIEGEFKSGTIEGTITVEVNIKKEILKLSLSIPEKFHCNLKKKIYIKIKILIITGFESIDKTQTVVSGAGRGFTPPDPTLGAGPKNLLAAVNTRLLTYDKKKNDVPCEACSITLGDFFTPVGAGRTAPEQPFDPWVLYDQYVNRFVVITVDAFGPTLDDPVVIRANLYLGISKSYELTKCPPASDYHLYAFDQLDRTGLPGLPTFLDFPKLGYDKDFYYIWGNLFDLIDGNFQGFGLTIIEKVSILNGGPANIVANIVIPDDGIVLPGVNTAPFPAQMFDCDQNVMYFVHTNELSEVDSDDRLIIIQTPSGTWNPQLTTFTVDPYLFNIGVPQPGVQGLLSNTFAWTTSAVVRNNKLWSQHHIRDPSTDKTFVRWYQLQVDVKNINFVPVLVQQANVDNTPLTTDNTWMAHLQVDACDNMGLVFSIGGTERFASIAYTGRKSSDPLNTTRKIQIVRNGENDLIIQPTAFRQRWGDYAGLAIDPCDPSIFWFYHEYAAEDPAGFSPSQVWKTFGGSFRIACCDKSQKCDKRDKVEDYNKSVAVAHPELKPLIKTLDPSFKPVKRNNKRGTIVTRPGY